MIEIDGKVQVLSLSDTDTLVYTTPSHLHAEQREYIGDVLRKQFPKNKVLVIDAGATLTVLTDGATQ